MPTKNPPADRWWVLYAAQAPIINF